MAGSTTPQQATPTAARSGCYVYGIVPADIEMNGEVLGVGDPPGPVTMARSGEIAALITDVALDRPLGTPQDLMAHQQLLDASAAEVPVLPFRFGAVMTDREAVIQELLEAHQDDFVAALRELDGRAEYLIKGRYVEDVLLREVLSENPRAAQLRERVVSLPPDAARNDAIALGEMINQAVAVKREADTKTLVDVLAPLCVAISVREPTHEEDAAHIALFVDADRQRDVERAVADVAEDWEDRTDLRLLGPLAAYDFVATTSPRSG